MQSAGRSHEHLIGEAETAEDITVSDTSGDHFSLQSDRHSGSSIAHKEAHGVQARLDATEAPQWSVRPFILSGYRPQLSVVQSLRSAIEGPVHNEHGNILSHLLGLIVYIALCIRHFALHHSGAASSSSSSSTEGSARADGFAAAYFSGVAIMLAASSVYHTLTPVSQTLHDCLYVLDLASVSANIVGIAMFVFDRAFVCLKKTRIAYLCAIAAMCFLLLLVACIPRLREQRVLVVTLFSGVVGTTVLPLVHINFLAFSPAGSFLAGPAPSGIHALAVSSIIMLAVYGIGVAIFGTRLPEKHNPGAYDLLFHSHQLWHIFVLLAPLPAYVGAQYVKGADTCSR